jgi:hypothetical protein
VRVQATRQLALAWDQEVRRQVTRTGRATGQARVLEPLGATVGAPALAALPAVLAEHPDWERVDDTFVHRVAGGWVAYHPLTQELEIVATLDAEVAVTGEAGRTVHGELADTLDVEGVGVYYDDNWGGRTHATAERDARADAEARLAEARREREERARAEVAAREADDLDVEAGREGDAALVAATAARSAELDRDATGRLDTVGLQGRNAFHQVLAQGYQRAILAFARSRRAERISCTNEGGVVEIEFELQI